MQFVFLERIFLLAGIYQLMNRQLDARVATMISLGSITRQKAMVFSVTPSAVTDTYTHFFRNQPPPKIFTDMGLSPFHARVNIFIEQLPFSHYMCAMDDFYFLARLCRYV